MTIKTTLKTVDDDFAEEFLGGILMDDSEITHAPDNTDDVDDTEEEEEVIEKKEVKNNVLNTTVDSFTISDLVDDEEEIVDNSVLNKKVKPTTSTATTKKEEDTIDYVNNLIEEGVLFGFDEEGFKVKTYEDVKEVILANKEEWTREVKEQGLEEDYSTFPTEFQYAVKYIKDGGTDMKSLFKVLSQSQELKELDPEKNPRETARTYLAATNFGTEEEIEEQLNEWEDTDLIEKKAKLFHPKIEKLAEENINSKLKEQEDIKKYQQELANQYFSGVKEALVDKNLNGIVLNKEEQNTVYKALTENNYVSSRNGMPMNFLGKFLEEITWDKPDYKMLAELALFAKDPKAYRDKIREQGKEEIVATTERRLRTSVTNIKATPTETNDDNKINVNKKVFGNAPKSNGVLKRHKF